MRRPVWYSPGPSCPSGVCPMARMLLLGRALGVLERWPSGLRRTLGKRVCVKAYPGFESLSLRHDPRGSAEAGWDHESDGTSECRRERGWQTRPIMHIGLWTNLPANLHRLREPRRLHFRNAGCANRLKLISVIRCHARSVGMACVCGAPGRLAFAGRRHRWLSTHRT